MMQKLIKFTQETRENEAQVPVIWGLKDWKAYLIYSSSVQQCVDEVLQLQKYDQYKALLQNQDRSELLQLVKKRLDTQSEWNGGARDVFEMFRVLVWFDGSDDRVQKLFRGFVILGLPPPNPDESVIRFSWDRLVRGETPVLEVKEPVESEDDDDQYDVEDEGEDDDDDDSSVGSKEDGGRATDDKQGASSTSSSSNPGTKRQVRHKKPKLVKKKREFQAIVSEDESDHEDYSNQMVPKPPADAAFQVYVKFKKFPDIWFAFFKKSPLAKAFAKVSNIKQSTWGMRLNKLLRSFLANPEIDFRTLPNYPETMIQLVHISDMIILGPKDMIPEEVKRKRIQTEMTHTHFTTLKQQYMRVVAQKIQHEKELLGQKTPKRTSNTPSRSAKSKKRRRSSSTGKGSNPKQNAGKSDGKNDNSKTTFELVDMSDEEDLDNDQSKKSVVVETPPPAERNVVAVDDDKDDDDDDDDDEADEDDETAAAVVVVNDVSNNKKNRRDFVEKQQRSSPAEKKTEIGSIDVDDYDESDERPQYLALVKPLSKSSLASAHVESPE